MILVVGGLASGKREFVKSFFGYTDAEMADAVIDDRPVLYNLQNLVTAEPTQLDSLRSPLLEKALVICNEVGCGIVPIDRAERVAREATGRLCVELAEHADKVYRVTCGIGTLIKGHE